MSGLGAQARAAEYAAATAARARQVSREAEERKLPPKSAPVSLGALAKVQPTSRNKGPKAWKPLNLDEITESSDDGSTGKESGQGTPAVSARMMLEQPSSFPCRQVSASSIQAEGIKVNIPTAPRAMMTMNVPATITANPILQSIQPEPFTEIPIRQSIQDVYLSPVSFGHGGFPYPAIPPHYYSHHPHVLGAHPGREATRVQRFDSIMVPSDLSPTKQQQKFAMLGQIRTPGYENELADTLEDFPHLRTLPPHNPSYYQHLNHVSTGTRDEKHGWDISRQDGVYVDYSLNQQLFEEQVNGGYGGDGEEEGEGGYYSGITASDQPIVQLPHGIAQVSYTFNEDSATTSRRTHAAQANAYPYRRSSSASISNTKLQPHSATYEHGEPYDRKGKMQRFVAQATHEALTRKGKTVLHNPDLYKAKDEAQIMGKHSCKDTDPSTTTNHMNDLMSDDTRRDRKRFRPVPWAVRPRLSDGAMQVTPLRAGQGQLDILPDLTKDELEVIAHAINDPAPGLKFPPLGSCAIVANGPIGREPAGERLNPIDQLGSEEWAQFRPITSTERERVCACMAKAAADLAPKISRPELFDKKGKSSAQEDDLRHSQEWFHGDFRGEQAFRAQLSAIAEEHAMLRRAAVRHVNGGSLPKDFKVGIDDGIAASVIMGEVIANLVSYVVGDRKSADQRKNFHKVKSVPEFATERGGVSCGSRCSDSYFDDDEAGFQGAPVRIARDPRFRPQATEELKLKPEEEWKNRREMYGRRVM